MWWKCKRFLADLLFNVLCVFWPNEKPSQAELTAYEKGLAQRGKEAQARVWIVSQPMYQSRERATAPLPAEHPHGAYFLQHRKEYMHAADRETQEMHIVFWEEMK